MSSNAKLRQILRKRLHSRHHKQRRCPRLHLEARSRWSQGENKSLEQSGLAVQSGRGPRDFWRPSRGLFRLTKQAPAKEIRAPRRARKRLHKDRGVSLRMHGAVRRKGRKAGRWCAARSSGGRSGGSRNRAVFGATTSKAVVKLC